MKNIVKKITIIVAIIGGILLLGIAGNADSEHHLEQQMNPVHNWQNSQWQNRHK